LGMGDEWEMEDGEGKGGDGRHTSCGMAFVLFFSPNLFAASRVLEDMITVFVSGL
jgi:hypothetical protein